MKTQIYTTIKGKMGTLPFACNAVGRPDHPDTVRPSGSSLSALCLGDMVLETSCSGDITTYNFIDEDGNQISVSCHRVIDGNELVNWREAFDRGGLQLAYQDVLKARQKPGPAGQPESIQKAFVRKFWEGYRQALAHVRAGGEP